MQSEPPGYLSTQCFVVSHASRSADRVAFPDRATTRSQSYRLLRLGAVRFENPCALQRCRARNDESPHVWNTFATRNILADLRNRQTLAQRPCHSIGEPLSRAQRAGLPTGSGSTEVAIRVNAHVRVGVGDQLSGFIMKWPSSGLPV